MDNFRVDPNYEISKYVPVDIVTINVEELEFKGSGSYSEVYEISQNKILKLYNGRDLNSSALSEIAILKHCTHNNIIDILGVIYSDNYFGIILPKYEGDLTRIPHARLPNALEKDNITYQILCGIAYLHSKNIIHRDIKPYNILWSMDKEFSIVIADLGGANIHACETVFDQNSTRYGSSWWLAPELLLGSDHYNNKIDVWATAVTICYVYSNKHIFWAGDDLELLLKIFNVFGTPNEKIWPDIVKLPEWKPVFPNWPIPTEPEAAKFFDYLPYELFELIYSMFSYDPSNRASCYDTLRSPYFDNLRDITEEKALYHNCEIELYRKDFYSSMGPTPQRNATIEKICEYSYNYELSIKTYLLAVHYADNYYADGEKMDPHLLAKVVVLLATMISEKQDIIHPLTDFLKITYSDKFKVLDTLNFDLDLATAFDYSISSNIRHDNDIYAILIALTLTNEPFRGTCKQLYDTAVRINKEDIREKPNKKIWPYARRYYDKFAR